MIPLADDQEVEGIYPLIEEFFRGVLYDEEPLFISDEATIWALYSRTDETELLNRCLAFYAVAVTAADLKQPLWRLVKQLNEFRTSKQSIQELRTCRSLRDDKREIGNDEATAGSFGNDRQGGELR